MERRRRNSGLLKTLHADAIAPPTQEAHPEPLTDDQQLEVAKAYLSEERHARVAAGQISRGDASYESRNVERQSLAEVTRTVKAPLYEELRTQRVAGMIDQKTWYAKAEQLKNQPVVEILQERAATRAPEATPQRDPEKPQGRTLRFFEDNHPTPAHDHDMER